MYCVIQTSVSARFHFLRIRIRIQRLRLETNTDTDPDPDPIRIRIQSGSRALMTKYWKKITAEKNIYFFFDQKLQFTFRWSSIKYVQVAEEAFSSQKRPSNTSKHELLQIFLLLWVIFTLLDPDPDPLARLNMDPIRIRISDPDPKPWYKLCVTGGGVCWIVL